MKRPSASAHVRNLSAVVAVGAMSLLASACGDDGEDTGAAWMFTQTSDSAEVIDGAALVMSSGGVFAFSDRPNREFVNLSAEEFVAFWADDEEGSFSEDPPNAVLAWSDGGEMRFAELALIDAEVDGDSSAVRYSIKVEEGDLAGGEISGVSLFIDSFTSQARQFQRRQLGYDSN